MLDEKVLAKIIVEGTVQGVGFRAFVKRYASSLGVSGYVMNMSEYNKVKIEAEGEKKKIEELIKIVKKGPMIGSVEKVTVDWSEFKNIFKDFIIKY